MDWLSLAVEARTSAEAEFLKKRYRTAISRAYYAAYSVLTQALKNVPVQQASKYG